MSALSLRLYSGLLCVFTIPSRLSTFVEGPSLRTTKGAPTPSETPAQAQGSESARSAALSFLLSASDPNYIATRQPSREIHGIFTPFSRCDGLVVLRFRLHHLTTYLCLHVPYSPLTQTLTTFCPASFSFSVCSYSTFPIFHALEQMQRVTDGLGSALSRPTLASATGKVVVIVTSLWISRVRCTVAKAAAHWLLYSILDSFKKVWEVVQNIS